MKKFTVCLLIGAMAASMLTGCGSNGGSSDSSDSKADSSSETMTIMMNGSDSDAFMEGYRKIIDGFNESNEYGVKVEIQNITNADYKTKLTTMMASDSEPDIIFTWPLGYLENFVNGDKIVSLQKYLDEDEDWKNSFNGGILDPLTYDGEVYAIPTQQSTAIMYYNKAIFDKYGLEVPTTYDEYVQVCDTLKENGVTPVALASTADDAWLVSQYIQQLSDGIKGEDLFNIQGTPPNLFTEIHGDAFAPRNPQALKIDFVKRPPYFTVSPTHKAKTWLLDPRAPKVEPPAAVKLLKEEGMQDA